MCCGYGTTTWQNFASKLSQDEGGGGGDERTFETGNDWKGSY